MHYYKKKQVLKYNLNHLNCYLIVSTIVLLFTSFQQYVLRLRSLIHDRHSIVIDPPRLVPTPPSSTTALTRSDLSVGSDRVVVLNLNAADEVAGPVITIQWTPVSVLLPVPGQLATTTVAVAAAATYTVYVVAEGPMREYGAAQLEKAKMSLPPCPARQNNYGTSGYFDDTKIDVQIGSSKGYGVIGWELPCVDAPWRLDTLCGLQRAAASLPVRGLVMRLPLLFQITPPINLENGNSSSTVWSFGSQVNAVDDNL